MSLLTELVESAAGPVDMPLLTEARELLDCGGTTPLFFHALPAPDAFEFTPSLSACLPCSDCGDMSPQSKAVPSAYRGELSGLRKGSLVPGVYLVFGAWNLEF